MLRFDNARRAWGTPDFEAILKTEIEQVNADQLPLQQGLSISSYVTDAPLKAIILRVNDREGLIQVKAGLFYSGIIAGCSCADDPTPISEQTEYCEVQIQIDKNTSEATVQLLAD